MSNVNWVKEAVKRLDGPSATQRRLYAEKRIEVSESTIYRWAREEFVNDSKAAFALSDMTGISARLLAGLDSDRGSGGPNSRPRLPRPTGAASRCYHVVRRPRERVTGTRAVGWA